LTPIHALVGVITLAYPMLIYWGLGRFEPRHLAWVLVAVVLARALITRQLFASVAALGAGVLAWLSFWGNALWPLKLYPVLVNAVFLVLFAMSLWHPPTAIERMARLARPNLPPSAVHYTRRVTQVWCVFFGLNGSVALATALWASDDVWALYNGLLSYVAMGVLLAVEWFVRLRVMARDELNSS
jgi:uncharacterized membrane protein